jgi:hypothetical protein
MTGTNKPFDAGYVISVTVTNMLKAVNFSIQRTFDRIPEFAGDPEKSKELFLTLTRLHGLKKQIEQITK